ncbi:MAG: M48 family metallopeptidase [Flavobacteriaceae bacterium]|jgi:predicted Zn-dependent protease|nr:M48 family metallopeptidase [Flavobacteriaceae bacterium]
MNKILPLLAFMWTTQIVLSQNLSEKNIEEIIEGYTASIEMATVIKDCGHVLDGPTFIAKQFENRLLDASVHFSAKQRKTLATDIFNDMIKYKKVLEYHPSKSQVLDIITKLTNQLQFKKVNYHLTIIDSQEINAFTTMGGYIYITTGLLDFVDTYDELAFIIGHEIAHEYKLHTQRKVTKLLFSSSLLKIIQFEDFKKMALTINSSVSAPFDQIDEYEADKYGVLLAKNAGYDVKHFGDFFEKLEKYEKRDLLTKLKSTHPFALHRKKCIDQYVD